MYQLYNKLLLVLVTLIALTTGIGTIVILGLLDIDGILMIMVLVGVKVGTGTLGIHDTRAIIDTGQATDLVTIMTLPPRWNQDHDRNNRDKDLEGFLSLREGDSGAPLTASDLLQVLLRAGVFRT